MPSDYSKRLDQHEIDDLVSYLMAATAKTAEAAEQKPRKTQQ
jgi:hypothetical protein